MCIKLLLCINTQSFQKIFSKLCLCTKKGQVCQVPKKQKKLERFLSQILMIMMAPRLATSILCCLLSCVFMLIFAAILLALSPEKNNIKQCSLSFSPVYVDPDYLIEILVGGAAADGRSDLVLSSSCVSRDCTHCLCLFTWQISDHW